MSSERERFVHIMLPGTTEFVTAGRFRWTPADRGPVGEFVYGRSYRERRDAVEIDPVELRLSDAVHQTARLLGFFGAIRDAMPDAWGRRVIEERIGSGAVDEFDYLEHAPGDGAGALSTGPTAVPPRPSENHNQASQLEVLQEVADLIVRDGPRPGGRTAQEVERLLLIGTSMGGARPKTQVLCDDQLWIAKFSRRDDRRNEPRIEHGMLRLARACGLAVPEGRVETVGDREVLLVSRFDRERAGTGFHRHRMASALTLLQVDENDYGRWSYLALADEIRRASESPREDLEELFARMCFNVATSNTDDHPRNHALIARGRGWRLSPAFDLNPFPAVSQERRLAMACGLQGRHASRENVVSGCGRFLLERDAAGALFDRVAETVRARWDGHMRKAGVNAHDREGIASAFSHAGLPPPRDLPRAPSFDP